MYKGEIPPKEIEDIPEVEVNNKPVLYPITMVDQWTILVQGEQILEVKIHKKSKNMNEATEI